MDEEINVDLLVIGGGPAGLSAAINGASELRNVALIDSGKKQLGVTPKRYLPQLGGQAVGSSLIENYAGFPEGVSGCELTERFEAQARKLGTRIYCPLHAASITMVDEATFLKRVTTREGTTFFTRTVILATGLSYNKLEAPGVAELLGKGVLYGAPTSNPNLLGACTVCVVGGANSAGQAVMHLAQNPGIKVKLLVRGQKPIEATMSQYLVDRIRACASVEVIQDAEVTAAYGNGRLEELEIRHGGSQLQHLMTDHLFIFIGASPKAQWLGGAIITDPRRFIVTGQALGQWHGPRLPYETSMPGVFVSGDARWGSIKRVAAGVGEGACAIQNVHQWLAEH